MSEHPSNDHSGAEVSPSKTVRKRRHRITVTGVLGEILLTAGALVLLFLGWQLWWNDMVVGNAQTSAAQELSHKWDDKGQQPAPTPSTSASAATAPTDYGEPPVLSGPEADGTIANLYIPRYGDQYVRTIAEGVGTNILNSTKLGIGHYPGTQLPGQVGNFAVASHRSAYGGGMHLINELQLGDPIIVETSQGWYTYRFRTLEYVQPSAVDVLNSVPQDSAAQPGDRIITLTSCNPLYSTAERVIAYGVFDSWQPRSAGPPASIAPFVSAEGK
jgi:sortase A